MRSCTRPQAAIPNLRFIFSDNQRNGPPGVRDARLHSGDLEALALSGVRLDNTFCVFIANGLGFFRRLFVPREHSSSKISLAADSRPPILDIRAGSP